MRCAGRGERLVNLKWAAGPETLDRMTVDGRQPGCLAREPLPLVDIQTTYRAQRMGLRREQSEQVLLAARRVDEAHRVIGDECVALIMHRVE